MCTGRGSNQGPLGPKSDALTTAPLRHLLIFHSGVVSLYMSLVMRKPAFCICKNKDADQLRGNRKADQRLCFRYTDSTICLLPIYEISSFYLSSVAAQPNLCGTWTETQKTGFLMTRLIYNRFTRRALIKVKLTCAGGVRPIYIGLL